MTLVELLLRYTAALVLLDEPSVGTFPLAVVAALGLSAIALSGVVAAVLTLVLGFVPVRSATSSRAPSDLVTRIWWSHPDSDGHARPRAPGIVAPA